MNLGKAIRELRKNKDWNQKQLAKQAAITQAALSQIENGKRPGTATLKKISSALKVPESLIYILALEKEDVVPEKQVMYDKIFPIIESLVKEFGKTE